MNISSVISNVALAKREILFPIANVQNFSLPFEMTKNMNLKPNTRSIVPSPYQGEGQVEVARDPR
jgi:hypothetical protein